MWLHLRDWRDWLSPVPAPASQLSNVIPSMAQARSEAWRGWRAWKLEAGRSTGGTARMWLQQRTENRCTRYHAMAHFTAPGSAGFVLSSKFGPLALPTPIFPSMHSPYVCGGNTSADASALKRVNVLFLFRYLGVRSWWVYATFDSGNSSAYCLASKF